MQIPERLGQITSLEEESKEIDVENPEDVNPGLTVRGEGLIVNIPYSEAPKVKMENADFWLEDITVEGKMR